MLLDIALAVMMQQLPQVGPYDATIHKVLEGPTAAVFGLRDAGVDEGRADVSFVGVEGGSDVVDGCDALHDLVAFCGIGQVGLQDFDLRMGGGEFLG